MVEASRRELELWPGELAVCRLSPGEPWPDWARGAELLSLTRTRRELSVVCEAGCVPAGVRCERGWRALALRGPLDFALVGLLAGLLEPLREAGVSVFALSTFDTDVLLVKAARLDEAIAALRGAGWRVVEEIFDEPDRGGGAGSL